MGKKNHLEGKTVFITGATSGIGEEVAYEAAKNGAIVLASGRREDKLQEVKRRCEHYSNKPAYVFSLDVTDADQIEQTVQQVIETVGVIDVLVNSAGFGETGEFLESDFHVAQEMFQVNVLGLMYITQLVAIHMAEQRSGHIISISSMAGKIATAKSAVYSASKHAVIGFSNALRLELAPLNISVTTANPGPVRTEFHNRFDPEGKYLESVDALVLEPDMVAKKIVHAMGTKKREINQPLILEGAYRLYTLAPTVGDFLTRTVFNKK